MKILGNQTPQAVVQRRSAKKVLLQISQNSQENISTRAFFCEYCEISKIIFFIENLWWLLLKLV